MILDLFAAPQLGGFPGFFAEGGAQMLFHMKRIDQRAVYIEGQNGLDRSLVMNFPRDRQHTARHDPWEP